MAPSLPKTIGRYEVVAQIGTGGMATVYLAQDPDLGDHQVAIKVIREGMDDPELLERLQREADSVRKLKHPNIVQIYGLGRHQGRPFIVMEYLEGRTLGELIREQGSRSVGRMGVVRRLRILEQLCRGLHAAHLRDVVHRDIKPDNVMVLVTENDLVKILDFGIARLGAAAASGPGGEPAPRPLTRAGWVMGTFDYMAPEQIECKPVDARADIFGVGAVTYELLSYRKPFSTNNPNDLAELGRKILYTEPEPLDALVPGIDPGLVAVVNRMLAKDRENRYPSLDLVCRDLEAARQRIAVEEDRRLQEALSRARRDLTAVLLDSAAEAVEEAISIDSINPEAVALRDRIAVAINERRQAEDLLRARRAMAEAKQLFDAGQIDDAIARLDAIQPRLPLVAETLARYNAEVMRIERERQEAERRQREQERLDRERGEVEARQREEAGRLESELRLAGTARRAAIDQCIARAEAAIRERNWDAARGHIAAAADFDAADGRLAPLRQRIEAGTAQAARDDSEGKTVFIQRVPTKAEPPRWPIRTIAAVAATLIVLAVAITMWSSATPEPTLAAIDPGATDSSTVVSAPLPTVPEPGAGSESVPVGVAAVGGGAEPREPAEPGARTVAPSALRGPTSGGVPAVTTSNVAGADGGQDVTAPPDNPGPPARPAPAPPAASADGDSTRPRALQAIEAGTKAENAGNFEIALEQFNRARALDPSTAVAVDQLVARVHDRMRTQGVDALRRGRQFDALGRAADAVPLYETALRLLPANSPDRPFIQGRLKILRPRR